MKEQLRKLCSPVLTIFEKGKEPYSYKPLNRIILLVVSFLFLGLAVLVTYLSRNSDDMGYLIPVIVFSGVSFVGFIVGLLGTDRAVSKIWGNR